MTKQAGREGRGVRIGLSFDQGTPKYALYVSTLLEAAARFGYSVEPVWLAGVGQSLDRKALASVDAIVLTGGADVDPKRYAFEDPDGLCRFAMPERDEVELPVLEEIFRRQVPTLAICRGMQFLNVFRGGTLVPDLPHHDGDDDTRRHDVLLREGSALATLAGSRSAPASTSHHQAVGRAGDGLRIVAQAHDTIAEAIEWVDPQNKPWLIAVQWHPERMDLDEALSGRIYEAFLQAVAARAS
jgi:putative glutamine amidotransferase